MVAAVAPPFCGVGVVVLWLGWALLAIAACGAAYLAAASAVLKGFFDRLPPSAAQAPGVTLLKPLHGAEPGLLANLESFCDQDYAGPVQIVFGLHDAADPALAVVEELRRRRPRADIAVLVDGRLHGPNRKVSNLANMSAVVAHDVLIASDSDIRVSRDYARRVVDALTQPGVGAVTCLYAGTAADSGFWSRLSAMGINYQFLPSAILGHRLGLAYPCCGATLAFRRPDLEKLGGFPAFASFLADDYEIGRAFRAQGMRVAIAPLLVTHGCSETRAGEWLTHELRWAHTIRRIDGIGYVGSLVTYPLAPALIGGALLHFPAAASALIVTILALRVRLAYAADAAANEGASDAWLAPLRDLLSFCIFPAAFFVNDVRWRGRRFKISPAGALIPLEEH
jgi:ceramide glucosyltransferase